MRARAERVKVPALPCWVKKLSNPRGGTQDRTVGTGRRCSEAAGRVVPVGTRDPVRVHA